MSRTTLNLLICPGIHPPDLTQSFLSQVQGQLRQPTNPANFNSAIFSWHVLPEHLPPYSPQRVSEYFEATLSREDKGNPVVWIAFSAGVVGAIATARTWQRQTPTPSGPTAACRTVALIAFDGWGVPLAGDFPIDRFSHDRFTAQTSEWPQQSAGRFYAEPAVEHLDLWRSPQTVKGLWHEPQPQSTQPHPSPIPAPMTAAEALATRLLQIYSDVQKTTPSVSL